MEDDSNGERYDPYAALAILATDPKRELKTRRITKLIMDTAQRQSMGVSPKN